MPHLRAILRLLLLLTGTVVLGLAAWVASLPPGTRLPRRQRVFRWWAIFVAYLIGLRRHVEGEAPPHGLLVSNHLGYLDVIVLAASREAVFVAKSEMAAWPIVGGLCRFVGTVFVRRARGRAVASALAGMEAALAGHRLVVLFPEGTSSDGRAVRRFHPALLEAAFRTSRPIGWAALSYFTDPGRPPAEQAVCWWGDMTLVDHVYRLLQLPRIHVYVTFGVAAVPSMDRKNLAVLLHQAIASARLDHERVWIRDPAERFSEM